ncbi:hypothetical protein PR048_030561 [Dryococelus australis]|uniref:Uncharacterized protein n=1 Tax=Dryococelus australis TaxID=614101 RepID=A0ABQ9G9B3_9NEOP|nr:hypothetical protein PR048_030561 [Dryococelus australis]
MLKSSHNSRWSAELGCEFSCQLLSDVILIGGRGGVFVTPLASHQVAPGSIPGVAAPGFSHVGILPDDAAGRRIFSGISLPPTPASRRCSMLTLLSCPLGIGLVFILTLISHFRFRAGMMSSGARPPHPDNCLTTYPLQVLLFLHWDYSGCVVDPLQLRSLFKGFRKSGSDLSPSENSPGRRGNLAVKIRPELCVRPTLRAGRSACALRQHRVDQYTEAKVDGPPRPRPRSEGAIRATLTRTPSASSLLRARRATLAFWIPRACKANWVQRYLRNFEGQDWFDCKIMMRNNLIQVISSVLAVGNRPTWYFDSTCDREQAHLVFRQYLRWGTGPPGISTVLAIGNRPTWYFVSTCGGEQAHLALHHKGSTFEINIRKKSLPLSAYILTGALCGIAQYSWMDILPRSLFGSAASFRMRRAAKQMTFHVAAVEDERVYITRPRSLHGTIKALVYTGQYSNCSELFPPQSMHELQRRSMLWSTSLKIASVFLAVYNAARNLASSSSLLWYSQGLPTVRQMGQCKTTFNLHIFFYTGEPPNPATPALVPSQFCVPSGMLVSSQDGWRMGCVSGQALYALGRGAFIAAVAGLSGAVAAIVAMDTPRKKKGHRKPGNLYVDGMKGRGGTGDPLGNPLTSGILRHDSRMRKSWSNPARD